MTEIIIMKEVSFKFSKGSNFIYQVYIALSHIQGTVYVTWNINNVKIKNTKL